MIKVDVLKEMCVGVAKKLVGLYCEGQKVDRRAIPASRLIFPLYERREEKTARISEQEARVLFLQEVQEDKYDGIYYSVETPTDYRYIFGSTVKQLRCLRRGRRGQSARYDMSLYEPKPRGKLKQAVNIEFKAHNKELTDMAKDFLKLMVEKYPGVFFHVLEKVDKNTLTVCSGKEQGILAKYERTFNELAKNRACIRHGFDDEESILFAICSLNPRFIMMKAIPKPNLMQGYPFLKFRYEIKSLGRDTYKMVVSQYDNWDVTIL